LGLAFAGLAFCGIGLCFSPTERLTDPLTIALAVCAVCATATYVPLQGKLLVDASFVPLMLAIAFLGPWPAFVIASVSELGAWTLQRYRAAVVPINLFSVGSVALVASAAFAALSISPGLLFYIALGVAGVLTLTINYVAVVSLMGLLDGYRIAERLGGQLNLVPVLAINVALGVAVTDIYAEAGLRVIVFVLVLMLAFNYMVRQTLLARHRTKQVERLAAMRAQLVSQTLEVEERERRVLAESLHDGAIQSLLSARQDLDEASGGEEQALGRAQNAVDESVAQLRDAVRHLHPSVLEAGGLRPAVMALARAHAERSGFVVDVKIDPRSVGAYDKLMFSLIRELVTNAAKHSHADRVTVRITPVSDSLHLEVQDDGVGFDPDNLSASVAAGHIGLAAAAERAEGAQGSMAIASAPGQGTRIRVELPLPAATPAPPESGLGPEKAEPDDQYLTRVGED
jgi:two-component system NarL family sensor kinase